MIILHVLEKAGRAAARISLAHQGATEHVVDKGDPSDFATQADLDAGAAMEKIFADEVPHLSIAAEENRSGAPKREFLAALQQTLDNQSFIVIDDIDATFEYDNSVSVGTRRQGGENFGHIAGTVENGVITRAMMYLPRRELMISAKRKVGCFVNGNPHQLQPKRGIEESMIYLVRHKDIPRKFDGVLSDIIYRLNPGGCVCYNANIAAIAGVALGTLSACVIAGKLWDIPGLLCVEEAGGFVASADGHPLNWSRIPQIVVAAATQKIGEAIVNITSRYPHYEEHFWNNPKFQS